MLRVQSIVVKALLLAMLAGSAAAGADPEADNRAVRRSAQTLLHSRTTADRIRGVERLGELPPEEGTRLLVQLGLGDRTPDVRRAAYEALLGWKDRAEVCQILLADLDKQSHTKTVAPTPASVPTAAPLIAVLMASEAAGVQDQLDKLLAFWAAPGKPGVPAVLAVADELGMHDNPQSLATLRNALHLKCFTESFACRRAIVQALVRLRQPEAVGALIDLLAVVDGEVRGDIVRHLSAVTTQPHGLDVAAWRAWWKENRDKFQFPANAAGIAGPLPGAAPAAPVSYYGLSVYAKRLVFVLDISSSMDGPRIETAKRELIAALGNLPEENDFGLVIFSSRVMPWQPGLTRATAANKQTAVQFVQSLRAHGMTATYDALEAAFHFDVEAIYFLSDGEPTTGRIVHPAEIVAAVSQANRTRRMSINCIGVMPGAPGSQLDVFLRTLAEQNYGLYRRVEQ